MMGSGWEVSLNVSEGERVVLCSDAGGGLLRRLVLPPPHPQGVGERWSCLRHSSPDGEGRAEPRLCSLFYSCLRSSLPTVGPLPSPRSGPTGAPQSLRAAVAECPGAVTAPGGLGWAQRLHGGSVRTGHAARSPRLHGPCPPARLWNQTLDNQPKRDDTEPQPEAPRHTQANRRGAGAARRPRV